MTKTIFRLKVQVQCLSLMFRKQTHVLAYTPVQCKGSMYIKINKIKVQVQFISSMYRFEIKD